MAGPEPSGRDLADDLISGDADRAAAARAALANGSRRVEAGAVKQLVERLRQEQHAADVCRAIADGAVPRLGPDPWSRLFKAIATANAPEEVRQPATIWMMAHTPAPDHRERPEAERPAGSTALVPRVLSVFTRIWVWVVLGLVGAFLVILMITTPQGRVPGAIALAALTLGCVLVDAVKRRCPRCRRFLAGELLSITHAGNHTVSVRLSSGDYVDRTRNSWDHNWRCVHCQRRWTT